MISCSCCQEKKLHFTAVDDGRMGYYCDACVSAGKLSAIGIKAPDQPGIIQPEAIRALPLSSERIH